ncbi:MAG: exodeoxyribonuclease III [Gammaproteobacteria bacterium]|nr:MAG: exodeoxyribonuclease III [Gammaproteobacteria bacterium]
MKIVSWNVNSLRVRLPHVLDWLESAKPDVLALQETKMTDENFPAEEIKEAGYHVVFSGQKTYNGVAIISTSEATDIVTDVPDLDDPQRRILAATVDGVRIIDLYVPNGQSVDSEKYPYKLNWLEKVTDYIELQLKEHNELVVLGDYNIAPDDRDCHDPEAWGEEVLCSKPERAAFEKLIGLGLVDTFRMFEQEDRSFSWWDYRQMAFRRKRGMRIDHVLASTALAEKCKEGSIDTEPRKLERPSDHAPAIAVFDR